MTLWSGFQREQQVFVWMAAIFVTSLVIANLTGALLFEFPLPPQLAFLGSRALLSAGIIPFPVTFLLTDLLNEYYGQKGARFVTFVGFGMSILVFLFLQVGEHLPYAPDTVLKPEEFKAFSGNYSGMFIASLTAYLIGQLLDIQVFQVFRKILQNKLLWVRATGSTVISQLFDSLIVTYIAFYDNLPFDKILNIAASNYTWKFLVAVAITPLLYLGHMILREILYRHQKPHSA